MGDPLGTCSLVPRNKTVKARGPKRTISCYGGADPGCNRMQEALWELIGFGVMGISKLCELGLEQSEDG
ncbi:hypothetical protein L3X38_030380 [Prunus dulcis]|uniref:Uncharacterized protein n=1 Tax=Prunus dulcis TaxID=3755 RepID=A0AAD4YU21_PRUDU|nr:hypothetical protein L3X38_030380 [Prunus dulcis]